MPPKSNSVFNMMTAAADKSAANLSKQFLEYNLDEKEIEQFYREDQRLIGESIEKKSDQDRQAEASFERMWQSTQLGHAHRSPSRSNKRRVEVSTGKEAVEEMDRLVKKGKKLYKSREKEILDIIGPKRQQETVYHDIIGPKRPR